MHFVLQLLPTSVIALQVFCLMDVCTSLDVNDVRRSKAEKTAIVKPIKILTKVKVKVNVSTSVPNDSYIKRPNIVLIVVDDVGT